MTKPALSLGPHIPSGYDLADAAAIQALMNGNADSEQQKRALKWVIERCSGMYEFHYYPSDRDTAFALGRAFVGSQIVKLSKLDLASLRRQINVQAPRTTT